MHLRQYDQMGSVVPAVYERLNGEYIELRERICKVFSKIDERRMRDKLPGSYAADLFCGLALHEFLDSLGFGIWQAADDNVWRFIAVMVIPDVVHKRLGGWIAKKDAFCGIDRSSRFWVRNIWWYIYLSLVVKDGRNDYKETENILSKNDTDILAGVVDHPGRGFRVDLFRRMMSKFDAFCKKGKLMHSREDVFRYMIKEYQIRTAVVDPDLEGVDAFLDEIFNKGKHLRLERVNR